MKQQQNLKRALRLMYFAHYRSHAIPLLYFKSISILMRDVFNTSTPCSNVCNILAGWGTKYEAASPENHASRYIYIDTYEGTVYLGIKCCGSIAKHTKVEKSKSRHRFYGNDRPRAYFIFFSRYGSDRPWTILLLIEFFFCYGSDRPWTILLLIEFFFCYGSDRPWTILLYLRCLFFSK